MAFHMGFIDNFFDRMDKLDEIGGKGVIKDNTDMFCLWCKTEYTASFENTKEDTSFYHTQFTPFTKS